MSRLLVILLLVLWVPIVPFVLFGDYSEAWISGLLQLQRGTAGGLQFLLVVVVLAVDILLPVPSSAVMTWAGATLGWELGALAAWLGLNLSCFAGYWLGRYAGLPLAQKLCSPDQLRNASDWLAKRGRWLLAGSRVIPVVAEACVLVAGIYKMSYRQFVLPIVLANLCVAVSFCALGSHAATGDSLLVAMIGATVLPILLLAVLRFYQRRRQA